MCLLKKRVLDLNFLCRTTRASSTTKKPNSQRQHKRLSSRYRKRAIKMGTVAELNLSREEGEEDLAPPTSSDDKSDRHETVFPSSIVWCTIPILSDVFPLVGHVGVTNSSGWIYDFIGDGTIHQSASNNLSFNRVMRVIPLDESKCKHPIDESLRRVMMHYTRTNERYNLFGQNCHDFVGILLNLSEYEGKDNWNLIDVAFLVWGIKGNGGSFVDVNAMYRTFGPVCVALAVAFVFGMLRAFLHLLLGLYGALVGWFMLYVYVLNRRRSCSIRAGTIPFIRNNKNHQGDVVAEGDV